VPGDVVGVGVVVSRTIETPDQLREVMRTDFAFSDQQFAAITAPLEPAVVIAGAGSGKTSVMAARVVWLVATGQVAPAEVLGLTFTTKATAELATRIRDALRAAGLLPTRRQLLGDAATGSGQLVEEVEEPTVATYHSYAAGLLTEHGLRIGHEPDTRLIADASRYQLAGRTIARHTAPVVHLSDAPQLVVQWLLALDGELSEHLVTPDQVRALDARERALSVEGMEGESRKTYRERNHKAILAIDRRAELLGLVDEYRDLKRHHGLMDFSDQIALTATLARDCPEVGDAERARFKVVLLDEYQDTSVAQAMMLARLFGGSDLAHGRGHPVTAVGDPNQAIYGWRGASVSNLLEFPEAFPTTTGRAASYPLTVNRRSDVAILDTANHLAAELYQLRPELRPLEPKPEALPGVVTAGLYETYDAELAALADAVAAAHDAMLGPSWREIGVLTRDNSHAADVFDALTRREIPVEIVGLKGLLRLPEVAEVVASLTLVQDVTANASLLTLLAGPRWAIGPRDLALLGRRAGELSGGRGRVSFEDLRRELDAAVSGSDPAEVASLGDALESPGDLDYSPEARARFGLLAAELRRLRAAVGEPILDLVRRIIDTCGIDVELASSASPAASARRDNLDLFVQAVAEFQAVDGQVTLAALLAWLEAEDAYGQGLDVATPSEADSVKLLTVHRAKGLEWDVVFIPGVTERKFPTDRSRSTWLTVPFVMPGSLRGDAHDRPVLGGHTPDAIATFGAATKEHERTEELRLAYVAWTRARHALRVTGWCFSPKIKGGRGASVYLEATVGAMADRGVAPEPWRDKPAKDEPNPYAALDPDLPWPMSHHTAEVERRHAAAAMVADAAAALAAGDPWTDEPDDMLVLGRIQEWDDELTRLIEEAARDQAPTIDVPLPSSLSATALARLRDDPATFAADLARPMPRPPSPAARFGTRFHAWVESRFGQQDLFDPDELPGRGDAGIDDDADLQELIEKFEAGPFADRRPYAVEAPFALVLDGQVVRGRIDAVYAEPESAGGGFLVVDWKTNRTPDSDPWQLALYRLAWAELTGVPLERVRARFYFVRTGDVVEPADLPGRDELASAFG
jgi:DNA helicase-2/ATP-dependent DNA helicase PcrA